MADKLEELGQVVAAVVKIIEPRDIYEHLEAELGRLAQRAAHLEQQRGIGRVSDLVRARRYATNAIPQLRVDLRGESFRPLAHLVSHPVCVTL